MRGSVGVAFVLWLDGEPDNSHPIELDVVVNGQHLQAAIPTNSDAPAHCYSVPRSELQSLDGVTVVAATVAGLDAGAVHRLIHATAVSLTMDAGDGVSDPARLEGIAVSRLRSPRLSVATASSSSLTAHDSSTDDDMPLRHGTDLMDAHRLFKLRRRVLNTTPSSSVDHH